MVSSLDGFLYKWLSSKVSGKFPIIPTQTLTSRQETSSYINYLILLPELITLDGHRFGTRDIQSSGKDKTETRIYSVNENQ